jgi:hypothetical protein
MTLRIHFFGFKTIRKRISPDSSDGREWIQSPDNLRRIEQHHIHAERALRERSCHRMVLEPAPLSTYGSGRRFDSGHSDALFRFSLTVVTSVC